MYLVFGAFHICLFTYVLLWSKKAARSFKETQRLCAVLEISVLFFFAVEGVFPYPDAHSLYMPIALMVIIILYTHTTAYTLIMIFGYTGAFTAMSVAFKTPEASYNDILIALATCISSLVAYVLTSNLRRSERSAMHRLEYANMIDALTALYNKPTMESLCAGRIREKNRELAFAIFDVDRFKNFNDLYGHACGDFVLREMGAALKESFRGDSFAGRFGGDEFLAMIDLEGGGRERARRVVKEALEKIACIEIEGHEDKISCCAGVAIFRGFGEETFSELFSRADKALYAAKDMGRGECVVVE
ncbi:MAG: GGDEF domain-containing protein [Clostridia bacterium]|nr:GGDEF domain-containing protein [Clostridia bacterium]